MTVISSLQFERGDHKDVSQILRTYVDRTEYLSACNYIQQLTQRRGSSYIVAANVHVVMLAYWRSDYRCALERSALVVPDGMPLVLGMRWLGAHDQSRVYGPDLMLAWCQRATEINQSIYLYGSTPETLQRLSTNLRETFPTLKIAGAHSPPFRPLTLQEEAADVERINQSGASVVFVGLGCPKQEEWMHRNVGKLNAVMIGVGAAFKFHSGEVKQAPRWMMRLSLEWLYRLLKEPRRLWARYLFTNTAFIVLFAAQLGKYRLNRLTQNVRAANNAS